MSDTTFVLLLSSARLCLWRTGDGIRPDLVSGFSIADIRLVERHKVLVRV